MEGCPFCVAPEDLPFSLGGIVYEDNLVCAHHTYQEGEPNYLGHLLVRTKRHVPGLAELTEPEGQALGVAVTRLSAALKTCTGAEKIYAEAYYEVVPHLHLFLTARYPGTPQAFWRWKIGEWPQAPRGGAKEISALCDRLRAHLYTPGMANL